MADLSDSGVNSETLSMLLRLSGPTLLVDNSSKIIAANASAAVLTGLPVEELTGQHWAGIDAQLTLIHWKMHWQNLGNIEAIEYQTDVLTNSEFLRPVAVRISLLSPNLALIELTDSIGSRAFEDQLSVLGTSTQAGTFFYSRISGKLWISPVARNLLSLPDTEDLNAIIAYCQRTFPADEWEQLAQLYQRSLQEQGTLYGALTRPDTEEKGQLLIEGQSAGNALHVTHIFGSIRQESKATFTVAEDITEELARFSIEEALEMIIWTTPDGKISYANQAVSSKLGYSREQLRQGKVALIAPYFNDDYRHAFWDELRKEKSISAEYDLFNINGDAIPITAEVNYLKFDGQEYACSFCRDLTKFLKRSALIELSQTALDITQDSIIWLNEDFSIRYVNQKVVALFGETSGYWTGRSFQTFFPSLREEDITSGNTLEVTVIDKLGQEIIFELRTDTIIFNEHHIYMLLGRDISKRLKREKNLQKALSEIQVLKEKIEQENVTLREEVSTNYNVNNIITVSPKYNTVLEKIAQVAEVDTTVLITGETGTGKELLARAIHQLSEREDAPLIKVNCAALPESLIESELFGHEKGAFTGAVSSKKGRFELADHGTLFLDEVGEMPLDLQAKLLRVLQEGEFERLGGTETISVDVRLIAATNRNLEKMVQEGRFRIDLYYRLNVFPIENPPLRERPEDIPVLIEYFAKKYAREQGKTITEIDSGDLASISKYSFPGNVRELENIVERAVVLCRSNVLRISFDKRKRTNHPSRKRLLTFEEMQRQHIIKALKITNGRITGANGAGKLLGLNDRTLMSKMRKLQIQKREYLL